MPLFKLGKIVATQGALVALGRSGQSPGEFIAEHAAGQWDDLDAHDTEANKAALLNGGRILSNYSTRCGDVIWILTEADRSSTCLLTDRRTT